MKVAGCVATIAMASLFLSCSANHHSIFRNQPLGGDAPSITTMDAKQRAILHVKAQDVRRFCSEPSPDVFSVIAQALSAGGSLGKGANPKSIEAALSAAFSTAEQGSTIPRTQTINMLRELMFRTCERYLNGAYSDLEMSIQAVRDQRLMISILAIEQLTGVVTPRPVVIGAGGSSSSGAGGDAIIRLDDAKKAKEVAAKARETAQATFDTVNGDAKVCDGIADALKTGKALTEEQTAKRKDCEKARSDLTAASQRATESSDYFAQLQKLAGGAGAVVSTYLTSSAQGGIDRAHGESVEKVATIAWKIVRENTKDDTEVMLFCLKALREAGLPRSIVKTRTVQPNETKSSMSVVPAIEDAGLRESCLSYLKARVDWEKDELMLSAEASASSVALRRIATYQFYDYWPLLQRIVGKKAGKDEFIKKLKDQLLPSEAYKADCFTSAAEEAQYRDCFLELPPPVQRDLSRRQ